MFELEIEVGKWRRNVEHSSSLSPREVDELEDHLLARFELELAMAPERSPTRVFNIVCDELGEPAAISKEFTKAGRRRWRPLLLAAWATFVASFCLPISRSVWVGVGSLNSDLLVSERAYEFMWLLITMGDVIATVWMGAAVLLPNLPMIMTLPALLGSRQPAGRWLPWVLGAMGVAHLGLGMIRALRPSPFMYEGGGVVFEYPGAGFWLWSASLALAGGALWLRSRSWAPSRSVVTVERTA